MKTVRDKTGVQGPYEEGAGVHELSAGDLRRLTDGMAGVLDLMLGTDSVDEAFTLITECLSAQALESTGPSL